MAGGVGAPAPIAQTTRSLSNGPTSSAAPHSLSADTLEQWKQEILNEVRREINKAKADIIDGKKFGYGPGRGLNVVRMLSEGPEVVLDLGSDFSRLTFFFVFSVESGTESALISVRLLASEVLLSGFLWYFF